MKILHITFKIPLIRNIKEKQRATVRAYKQM